MFLQRYRASPSCDAEHRGTRAPTPVASLERPVCLLHNLWGRGMRCAGAGARAQGAHPQASMGPWKNASLLRFAAACYTTVGGFGAKGGLGQCNKTPFPQAHIPGAHKTCTGWTRNRLNHCMWASSPSHSCRPSVLLTSIIATSHRTTGLRLKAIHQIKSLSRFGSEFSALTCMQSQESEIKSGDWKE